MTDYIMNNLEAAICLILLIYEKPMTCEEIAVDLETDILDIKTYVTTLYCEHIVKRQKREGTSTYEYFF